MHARFTRRLRVAALAAAVAGITAGCAPREIPRPSIEDIRASLEGQRIELGAKQTVLAADRIASLRITAMHENRKGGTATAEIRFDYAVAGTPWEVEGVISYVPAPDGKMQSPYFEAMDVRTGP
jgi:hypothetical protein